MTGVHICEVLLYIHDVHYVIYHVYILLYMYMVLFRFKGSKERGDMLLDYVCDLRISTEQQLTGE